MDLKNIISISEARKKIFDIVENIQKPGSYYILTEKGRSKAVLMSAEEFESWKETVEVLREFPDLDQEVKKINKAVKSGEYKRWEKLDDILAK